VVIETLTTIKTKIMNIDYIELGLDKMTDNVAFEKLATEIMYNEGYYDIKIMPGGSEFGQDAIQENIYISEISHKIVFQFTIQENAKEKIKKTIERLQEKNIKFSELIYVTKHRIEGQNQIKLKTFFLNTYRISLQIFEKETILTRLAHLDNKIFDRFFSDIEKQLQNYTKGKSLFSDNYSNTLEFSLLKTSIAFTFNPENQNIRDNVFDNLIIALLHDEKEKELTIHELLDKYVKFQKYDIPQIEQINSALNRLKKKGYIKNTKNISLTNYALTSLEIQTIRSNEKTNELIEYIIEQLIDVTSKSFTKIELGRIRRNILEVLSEIFQLHGLELSNQFINSSDGENNEPFPSISVDDLVNKASYQLNPPEIGLTLISIIVEIFRKPNKEHATTLSNWSKAFIGIKIMSLDPKLKQLQLTQFAKKIIFLDTDFVLNCLIKERPAHSFYLEILKSLVNVGCLVVIPTTIIQECVGNAERAYNTYKFFGDTLFSFTDDIIDGMVGNLFVQGFYYANKSKIKKEKFSKYIENYYEEDNPDDFFATHIKNQFPKKVKIEKLEKYPQTFSKEEYTALKNRLVERLKHSRKAIYRSEEQNDELADIDAKLFLTSYYLNKSETTQKNILGGKSYLLTLSLRFLKCSKDVGLKDIVTIKPQTIASVLSIIGQANYNSQDFIQFFDNPLLIYAIEQNWDNIKTLVKSGIELNGKSLSRLQWDMKKHFHNSISEYERLKDNEIEEIESQRTKKYLELIKTARQLGYNCIPEVNEFEKQLDAEKNIESYEKQKLISKIQEKEQTEQKLKEELDNKTKEFDILQSEMNKLSKRKQFYLNKITKKKK